MADPDLRRKQIHRLRRIAGSWKKQAGEREAGGMGSRVNKWEKILSGQTGGRQAGKQRRQASEQMKRAGGKASRQMSQAARRRRWVRDGGRWRISNWRWL